jgi:hypothetical protein
MSITIYWSLNDESWLRAKTPDPIYKNFVQSPENKKNSLILCPATKDYMQNIFSLKSIFSYDFKIDHTQDGNDVTTSMYNQKFFDNHVTVRSKEDKLFSFTQRFCFYTEEKSLLMSAGILPFLEDNNITKRCVVIPGTFDIGRWFRRIEFAFYLKKDYDEFKIEEDEIYQYIKFHTNEKIIFKQFRVNSKIQDLIYDIDYARNFRKEKFRSLEEYYLMLKNKKHIIKEIKNNLVN